MLHYGPLRRGFLAALCFTATALTLPSTIDWEHGIPERSALIEASGQAVDVHTSKNTVVFRLEGRSEKLIYSRATGGIGSVKSAFSDVYNKYVTVLFDPGAHDVWQVAVDGRIVQSFAESRQHIRTRNALASLLCPCALLAGIYMSLLAVFGPPAWSFWGD